jgi:hypothetical protein
MYYCNHGNHVADVRHDNRFFTVPAEHSTPGHPLYQGSPTCPVCGGQGSQYMVTEKVVPSIVARLHQAGIR